MKKTISKTIFMISLIVLTVSVWASVKIPIYINGKELNTSHMPYITSTDRVMIPYEDVAKPLGIELKLKDGVLFSKGRNVKTGKCINGKLEEGKDIIIVNDKEVKVDNSIEIKDDVVYLPLRLMSELYGYKVNWTGNSVEIECP